MRSERNWHKRIHMIKYSKNIIKRDRFILSICIKTVKESVNAMQRGAHVLKAFTMLWESVFFPHLRSMQCNSIASRIFRSWLCDKLNLFLQIIYDPVTLIMRRFLALTLYVSYFNFHLFKKIKRVHFLRQFCLTSSKSSSKSEWDSKSLSIF